MTIRRPDPIDPVSAKARAYRRGPRQPRVGEPCHAVKADGNFCSKPAKVIATDGHAYCDRHAR